MSEDQPFCQNDVAEGALIRQATIRYMKVVLVCLFVCFSTYSQSVPHTFHSFENLSSMGTDNWLGGPGFEIR